MIENNWKPLGQAGQTDRQGKATDSQVARVNDAIWWDTLRQRQTQIAQAQGKQKTPGSKP